MTYPNKVEINGENRLFAIFRVLFFAVATVFKFGGPFLFIFLALMTILLGLMPTVLVYVGKLVLDAIVNIVQMEADSAAIDTLIHVLVIQLLALVGNALLHWVNGYLIYFISNRLSLNVNTEIMKKISMLDYAFFENSEFYDVMNRARKGAAGRPLSLVLRITSIVQGCITFMSMASLVLTLSLFLSITMVIICLPLLFIQVRYGKKNYELQFNRTEEMRMAGYVNGIMTTREFLPEILSFDLWEHLFKKWYGAAQRFFRQDVHLRRKRTIAQIFSGLLAICSTVLALIQA